LESFVLSLRRSQAVRAIGYRSSVGRTRAHEALFRSLEVRASNADTSTFIP
jgi:hypothetical protein